MHFSASDTSKKMIMDLVSSANDICVRYGSCEYLGKVSKDDLESRQTSASVVLTPGVSETARPSRASAADNPHTVLGLQRGTSQHDHHLLRAIGLLTVRERERATDLPTHLPTYQPTFLLTYPPIFLPTYPPTFLPTYPPAVLPTYSPTYLPTFFYSE